MDTPGHCSYLRLPGDVTGWREYLMFHARFGSMDAPRQMALAPLRWTAEGLPYTRPFEW